MSRITDMIAFSMKDAHRDGKSGVIESAATTMNLEALLKEIEKLEKDKERLDWLDENIFHRELDDFDRLRYKNYNMWVTFAPCGFQGTSRNIIDAAKSNQS